MIGRTRGVSGSENIEEGWGEALFITVFAVISQSSNHPDR